LDKSILFRKIIIFTLITLLIAINNVQSTETILKKSTNIILNGNTLYVGGSGPGNYSNIHDAIENASDGDTVFVFNGIYSANIVIDKSISLIGEDQDYTIIEGESDGFLISADYVKITKFTIQKCGGFWHHSGIYVGSDHNTISHVSITNNGVLNGIFLEYSFDNIITNNTIKNNNYYGIRLDYSSYNIIVGNFVSNIITNGISLTSSSNNEIYSNTLKKCSHSGISICCSSEDNKLYHNNLINNSLNNGYDECNNFWDNDYPSGGNFWDDYAGVDVDGDGIGDTPYPISGGINEDRYPLMKPYGSPEAPIIKGPANGRVGKKYYYTFECINPGEDNIYYYIDWDDGTNSGWLGPYESGLMINLSHSWKKQDVYIIKAKSKNTKDLESDWGEKEINIPRNKTTNNLLFRFFNSWFYYF